MRPVEDRFWSKVRVEGECWIWTGSRNNCGYGTFHTKSTRPTRIELAHRVAFRLAKGVDVPAGFMLLHSCDQPACVRVSHLRIGTHQDNMADRDERGRTLAGDRHPLSKATEAQVVDARRRHAAGERVCILAKELGLSWRATADALNGRTWRHVPMAEVLS